MTTDPEMKKVMSIPLFTVDAFASKPFSGNPAAVCLLLTTSNRRVSEATKQKIASEMNLSETAFLSRIEDGSETMGSSSFRLQWFTPTTEVELCGHATLASAAVLFDTMPDSPPELRFRTLSGTLIAKRVVEGKGRIAIDLPINVPEKLDQELESSEALRGLVKMATGTLPYEEVLYSAKTKNLLIRLKDSVTRHDFEAAKPPLQLMVDSLGSGGLLMGVILTLKGSALNGCVSNDGKAYDFVSRYFAPWVGVPEDPVTGLAHTILAGYWSKVLEKKDMFARQCSTRGGELWVNVLGDGRVGLSGNAIIMVRGSLVLEDVEESSTIVVEQLS